MTTSRRRPDPRRRADTPHRSRTHRRPAGRGAAGNSSRRPSSMRTAVTRASRLPQLYLRSLPRPVPPLVVLAVATGGIALPGVAGAVLLMAVAGILGWLAYLSWPVAGAGPRGLRIVAIAAVVGIAVVHLVSS